MQLNISFYTVIKHVQRFRQSTAGCPDGRADTYPHKCVCGGYNNLILRTHKLILNIKGFVLRSSTTSTHAIPYFLTFYQHVSAMSPTTFNS